jgi:transposase
VEVIEEQIPAAEMERMMKAQEVILKAAAGKITWMAAAEIMGVTDRTMRRWRERLNEHGYSGLWDYCKRRPSPKRVPMATVEQVLQLYREQYFDFNVRHFHEKLKEAHGIKLSYSWVKTALQTAGFVKAQEAGLTSQAAAAAASSGHDAAHRWQRASVVRRRPVLRVDRHLG